ncbi:MAG: UMP kinase, partial [Pseudomonadota bacterium]|nr:UMP kinase [Pseudomonadota bacterium]
MNDKGDSRGGPAQRYKRVLLKISGESLMGGQSYGIDPEMVATVASQVRDVVNSGVEACLVIGGGNIFR